MIVMIIIMMMITMMMTMTNTMMMITIDFCSNGDPMPAVSWRKAGVPVNPDGLDTDAARW